MAATTPTAPSRSLHKRNLSPLTLFRILFTMHIWQLLTTRKTFILGIVWLLPIAVAIFYLLTEPYVDGLTVFREILEHSSIPFLIPLTALFYGGPAIVDEIEGRTLTYLTLRPIPRHLIFMGKFMAGVVAGLSLTLFPLLILFLITTWGGNDPGASFSYIARVLWSCTLSFCAYSAIFGTLGAIFAKSLLSGIIYFATFELVLSNIPVFEIANIRFLTKTAIGISSKHTGVLGAITQETIPSLSTTWAQAILVTIFILGALLGSFVFSKREYNV